jgi:nucleoside-diphosphate-sugar epimerase
VIGGAVRHGLPSIVYVSSLGVFFEPGGSPLSPELPIAPGTTAYARSKANAEGYARRLQEQGVLQRGIQPTVATLFTLARAARRSFLSTHRGGFLRG